jgi:thymidylate synthase
MSFSEKIKLYKPEWFTIEDYMPHPTIKFPLSN